MGHVEETYWYKNRSEYKKEEKREEKEKEDKFTFVDVREGDRDDSGESKEEVGSNSAEELNGIFSNGKISTGR